MKKTTIIKRELSYLYGTDIALGVFNFLICSVLCAGGSELLNITGVIAFAAALIPICSKRLYCKDEPKPDSAVTVMMFYRIIQTALLLYGIDYFLIA